MTRLAKLGGALTPSRENFKYAYGEARRLELKGNPGIESKPWTVELIRAVEYATTWRGNPWELRKEAGAVLREQTKRRKAALADQLISAWRDKHPYLVEASELVETHIQSLNEYASAGIDFPDALQTLVSGSEADFKTQLRSLERKCGVEIRALHSRRKAK